VEQVRNDTDVQFVVQGKEYWTLDSLDTPFSFIETFPEHRYSSSFTMILGGLIFRRCSHIYHHEKRYNENDGLIFVMNDRPLRPGICDATKKWKWPHLTTVIFKVKIEVELRNDGRPPRTVYTAFLGGVRTYFILFFHCRE
jgi:hypothetical protein